jgi:hypothetical protein
MTEEERKQAAYREGRLEHGLAVERYFGATPGKLRPGKPRTYHDLERQD